MFIQENQLTLSKKSKLSSVLTWPNSISHPQLQISLENQNIANMVAVKPQSQADTGETRIDLKFSQSLRKLLLFDVPCSLLKYSILRACLCLIRLKSSFYVYSLICSIFVENSHQQLFNTAVAWAIFTSCS